MNNVFVVKYFVKNILFERPCKKKTTEEALIVGTL